MLIARRHMQQTRAKGLSTGAAGARNCLLWLYAVGHERQLTGN